MMKMCGINGDNLNQRHRGNEACDPRERGEFACDSDILATLLSDLQTFWVQANHQRSFPRTSDIAFTPCLWVLSKILLVPAPVGLPFPFYPRLFWVYTSLALHFIDRQYHQPPSSMMSIPILKSSLLWLHPISHPGQKTRVHPMDQVYSELTGLITSHQLRWTIK